MRSVNIKRRDVNFDAKFKSKFDPKFTAAIELLKMSLKFRPENFFSKADLF